MSNFNQYNETPTTRTDKQVVTQQETDILGNQKVTQATSLDRYDEITAYPKGCQTAVITTATTTTPHTGSGLILGLYVSVALTGTVTIYDDTTQKWSTIPASTPAGFIPLPAVRYSTSVKVVTSAADKVTICYLPFA